MSSSSCPARRQALGGAHEPELLVRPIESGMLGNRAETPCTLQKPINRVQRRASCGGKSRGASVAGRWLIPPLSHARLVSATGRSRWCRQDSRVRYRTAAQLQKCQLTLDCSATSHHPAVVRVGHLILARHPLVRSVVQLAATLHRYVSPCSIFLQLRAAGSSPLTRHSPLLS